MIMSRDRRDRISAAVEATLRGAVARTALLDKVGSATDKKSGAPLGYFGGDSRGDYCLLDAKLAAIPEHSLAATADLGKILFAESQHILTKEFLLKPQADWPKSSERNGHIHLGVKRGHYVPLLKRMELSGMITYLPSDGTAIENSIFGVWKVVGESQRLIWAGNRSNPLFSEAASEVELPTPDLLSSLQLGASSPLHLASCDVSQFYNRLRAPDFLIPFLGLPRVRAADVQSPASTNYVVPCLLCIPMGATFAVALAQKASLAIIRHAGLSHALVTMGRNRKIDGKSGRVIVYIDDVNVVGTSAKSVNESIEKVIRTFASFSLPDVPAKRQYAPSSVPPEALGLWWWPDGILTIKASAAYTLKNRTEALLANGSASPDELRSIGGSWVWSCLLRRGLLSTLDALFDFCQQPHAKRRRVLPGAVVIELNMLLDLFPLMFCDLRLGVYPRVYASDASTNGGGVVYSDLSTQRLRNFLESIRETHVRKGWWTRLSSSLEDLTSTFESTTAQKVSRAFTRAISRTNFKLAIATAWRRPGHINLLEMEAAILAVRHIGRSSQTANHRLPLLIDNTTALGALSKGRSSSSHINRSCRRFIAAQILAGVVLDLYWVPSDLNPADGPSRAVNRKKQVRIARPSPNSG